MSTTAVPVEVNVQRQMPTPPARVQRVSLHVKPVIPITVQSAVKMLQMAALPKIANQLVVLPAIPAIRQRPPAAYWPHVQTASTTTVQAVLRPPPVHRPIISILPQPMAQKHSFIV